jgi:hypothetical protein
MFPAHSCTFPCDGGIFSCNRRATAVVSPATISTLLSPCTIFEAACTRALPRLVPREFGKSAGIEIHRLESPFAGPAPLRTFRVTVWRVSGSSLIRVHAILSSVFTQVFVKSPRVLRLCDGFNTRRAFVPQYVVRHAAGSSKIHAHHHSSSTSAALGARVLAGSFVPQHHHVQATQRRRFSHSVHRLASSLRLYICLELGTANTLIYSSWTASFTDSVRCPVVPTVDHGNDRATDSVHSQRASVPQAQWDRAAAQDRRVPTYCSTKYASAAVVQTQTFELCMFLIKALIYRKQPNSSCPTTHCSSLPSAGVDRIKLLGYLGPPFRVGLVRPIKACPPRGFPGRGVVPPLVMGPSCAPLRLSQKHLAAHYGHPARCVHYQDGHIDLYIGMNATITHYT